MRARTRPAASQGPGRCRLPRTSFEAASQVAIRMGRRQRRGLTSDARFGRRAGGGRLASRGVASQLTSQPLAAAAPVHACLAGRRCLCAPAQPNYSVAASRSRSPLFSSSTCATSQQRSSHWHARPRTRILAAGRHAGTPPWPAAACRLPSRALLLAGSGLGGRVIFDVEIGRAEHRSERK